MKAFFLIIFLACTTLTQAQLRNQDVYEVREINQSRVRTEISIPGFNGYQTLKCDFHVHTVFSDGKVWPDIRVNEAWQYGLDAVAITDHIEYRPNKEILKGDLNESYKIAKKAGDAIGFIVIQGTEITRSKPLGHLNALFINDAMPLDVEDPLTAIDEAKKQGAFVMWNHPGWPDNKSTLYPVHEELIKAKKIDGIEVFNSMEYYPVSFDWCDKYKLAFMGNTDVHNTLVGDYGSGIRPMTLVFATEKSKKGIKDALFAGRTVAFFNGELAGDPVYLQPLVLACLQIRPVTENTVEVSNISDIPFRITGDDGNLYLFPAKKTILLSKKLKTTLFTVTNCHIGMDQKLTIPVESFFSNFWPLNAPTDNQLR